MIKIQYCCDICEKPFESEEEWKKCSFDHKDIYISEEGPKSCPVQYYGTKTKSICKDCQRGRNEEIFLYIEKFPSMEGKNFTEHEKYMIRSSLESIIDSL